MLIGGLWHGANWTFVLWGAYHGILLVLYRQWRSGYDRLSSRFKATLQFFLVVVGWVPFRMLTLSDTFLLWRKMFRLEGFFGGIPLSSPVLYLTILGCALIAHGAANSFEMKHQWRTWQIAGFALGFVFCLVWIAVSDNSPFLYFQF